MQDGWSPLLASCFNGHLDVVKTLIEAGANINQANKVSTHITTVHVYTFYLKLHYHLLSSTDAY